MKKEFQKIFEISICDKDGNPAGESKFIKSSDLGKENFLICYPKDEDEVYCNKHFFEKFKNIRPGDRFSVRTTSEEKNKKIEEMVSLDCPGCRGKFYLAADRKEIFDFFSEKGGEKEDEE